MNCFPELPVGRKCTSHRTFKIDLSSVGLTMDHVVHKHRNGIQAASDNKKMLLQNNRKQKLSELHSNEEFIDRGVLQQRSNREVIDIAFNAKLISMDEKILSLESEILEEDELSYLSHVVEKTIQDMTLESEIECELPEMNKGMLLQKSMPLDVRSQELCLEKGSQLDGSRLNFQVMSSVNSHNVQLNYADLHMVLSEGHSITKETERKDISYELEAKDILIMPQELQYFSEKLNKTSTCSLEQKEETNLSASNISRSGLEILCVKESGIKDHLRDPLHLSQSSQFDSSNSSLCTSSCADGIKDTYKLQVPQKDFAREIPGIHTPDHDKEFLANMDRKIELSQEKKTKYHNLSSSPILQSNISPALKVLKKRRSESHIIAYDVYNPCNASIQKGTLQTCSPLVSKSQETIDSRIDFKEAEDIGERGFSIGNTSRSPTHLEIKCKKISERKNKVNLTAPSHRTPEKSECSICIGPKVRKKELLNCKDWQCLEGAGTSWKSGVRRSLRIRSRPLEFWRGERFLYGRVLNCLSTVIGIKYTSPESVTTGKDKSTRFKVQSYVDEKYSDAVNFAALY